MRSTLFLLLAQARLFWKASFPVSQTAFVGLITATYPLQKNGSLGSSGDANE